MWGGLPCIYMRILWKEVFNPIHFIYMCLSKVIMMCGVCGSGKTTYAKKKEQEGYIRLSIDEEMWKLYGRKGIDYPEEEYEKLSEQVEAALQKKLLSLIQQGKDVVIDFSFCI